MPMTTNTSTARQQITDTAEANGWTIYGRHVAHMIFTRGTVKVTASFTMAETVQVGRRYADQDSSAEMTGTRGKRETVIGWLTAAPAVPHEDCADCDAVQLFERRAADEDTDDQRDQDAAMVELADQRDGDVAAAELDDEVPVWERNLARLANWAAGDRITELETVRDVAFQTIKDQTAQIADLEREVERLAGMDVAVAESADRIAELETKLATAEDRAAGWDAAAASAQETVAKLEAQLVRATDMAVRDVNRVRELEQELEAANGHRRAGRARIAELETRLDRAVTLATTGANRVRELEARVEELGRAGAALTLELEEGDAAIDGLADVARRLTERAEREPYRQVRERVTELEDQRAPLRSAARDLAQSVISEGRSTARTMRAAQRVGQLTGLAPDLVLVDDAPAPPTACTSCGTGYDECTTAVRSAGGRACCGTCGYTATHGQNEWEHAHRSRTIAEVQAVDDPTTDPESDPPTADALRALGLTVATGIPGERLAVAEHESRPAGFPTVRLFGTLIVAGNEDGSDRMVTDGGYNPPEVPTAYLASYVQTVRALHHAGPARRRAALAQLLAADMPAR